MQKKIVFLLGSANMSGGTYVILQHALFLQKNGYDVTIALVFMEENEFSTLKDSPDCWHPAIKELSFIQIDHAKQYHFDVAFITWWATIYSLEKVNAAAYFYFVQSIESRFYDQSDTFMRDLVNRTYQLGLPVITEAVWIQQFLQTKYQNECELVRNGILKSVYQLEGQTIAEKSPQQLRILVEGPLDVAFKNVEKTIALCKEAKVGEIWLLTSTASEYYPGVAKIFSKVPIHEVPAIYRSCDVLVKLSYVEGMFGPPLEMFHCGGTAIVYDVTGHDEYIEHNKNALVIKTDDEQGVVNALKQLHQDRQLLARLTEGAKETAKKWINWDQSSDEFRKATEKLQLSTANTSQKANILKRFSELFRERLPIVIMKNGQRLEDIIETSPLYHSGFYGFCLLVPNGKTQIGLAFGKTYKSFYVTKLTVDNISGVKSDMRGNLSTQHMIQHPNQLYECQSKDAMLMIDIDINVPIDTSASNYQLQIEFRPHALWEESFASAEFETSL